MFSRTKSIIDERFAVIVDDNEISAETFETIGILYDFLACKLAP
jgi:hypothetical protein